MKKTRNHPPVCREGGIHVQLYGERGRGGGGGREGQRRRTTRSRPSGTGSLGDDVSYQDPPPLTAKYYHRHSQGARPQALGRPGRHIRGRPARHWLEPVGDGRSVKVHCHRWGRHPQQRTDTEGWKGKGRAQACGTWRGEVGEFRLEETQDRKTET